MLAVADEAKERLGIIERKLRSNPLLQEFAAECSSGGKRSHTPKRALAEKLYWTWVCASNGAHWLAALPKEGDITSVDWVKKNCNAAANAECSRIYIENAERAQVYLWTNETRSLANNMPPLPAHTIPKNLLPYQSMFFSWEGAARTRLEGEYEFQQNALLLFEETHENGKRIVIVGDLSRPATLPVLLHHFTIPVGGKYPEDIPLQTVSKRAAEAVLKLLYFISSKIVIERLAGVSRAEARRLLREGMAEEKAKEKVSVVTLRDIEYTNKDKPEKESQNRYDRWRWWVRGHWRNQWCSSTETHRPTWIAPFVKGPPGKPMLDRVYHVKR